MNDAVSRIAIALNPIVALIITVAGGVIAGHFSPNPIGVAVGVVTGLALAVPLCGGIGLLASIDRHTQRMADEAMVAAVTSQTGQQPAVAAAKSPVAHARGHAISAATTAAPAVAAAAPAANAAVAAEAGAEAVASEMSASDAERGFLERGLFAEYHLSKAKRMLAAGNAKEAANQAAAALAHEPRNQAARELRRTARAKG